MYIVIYVTYAYEWDVLWCYAYPECLICYNMKATLTNAYISLWMNGIRAGSLKMRMVRACFVLCVGREIETCYGMALKWTTGIRQDGLPIPITDSLSLYGNITLSLSLLKIALVLMAFSYRSFLWYKVKYWFWMLLCILRCRCDVGRLV